MFPVEAVSIKHVFNTLMTQIIAEAKQIIKLTSKAPKAILLVGGMSANPYLRDKITAAFPKVALQEHTQGNQDQVVKGEIIFPGALRVSAHIKNVMTCF